MGLFRAVWLVLFIASLFIVWFFLKLPASAHLPDRPDLNQWFESLKSQRGLCCSFADAEALTDVQWDIRDDGHYAVFIDGKWMIVPDNAVITTPNKYGQAIVWPIRYQGKAYDIRCFIPGAGT